MSNFSFLEVNLPNAARLGKKAEGEIVADTHATAIHTLRNFAEDVSKFIAKKHGRKDLEHCSLDERLKTLKKYGMPDHIFKRFVRIKDYGNDAVHEFAGTKWEAIAQLESAFIIANWIYKKYFKSDFKSAEFIPPSAPPSVNIVLQPGRNRVIRLTHNPGDPNKNRQILVKKTDQPGNSPYSKLWILKCSDCSNEYGANGFDFHIRKCPACQGGAEGIPYKPE